MATLWIRGKKKKIYLRFRWNHRQMVEPTPYLCENDGKKGCKCRSCKSADALAYEIERKIAENSFNLQDYFPSSKALKNLKIVCVDEDISFATYALQWLDFKESVTTWSTYKGYRSIVRFITPLMDLKVKDVRPAHLRGLITHLTVQGASAKRIKNILSVVYNILTQAVEDSIIAEHPGKSIKLPKIVKEPPDPFTFDEVKQILTEIRRVEPVLVAFFAIGFYAGLRTGEIMALEWEDIDFNKSKIKVSKTMTEGKLKKGTKTGHIITVDIIAALMPYLQEHKQYTFLRGGVLFRTAYDEAIRTYNVITRRWEPALKKLGIRYRQPYQMRHTFAVLMLAAGEDPNWVKNQLGHNNLTMLFNTYGNWYNPGEIKAGSKFSDQNMIKLKSEECK